LSYNWLVIEKPREVHARDVEWSALADFATRPDVGAALGLVYGRRRQGKTFLLEFLAETSGGFMHTATQQSETQQLRALGEAYARFTGAPGGLRFDGWSAAVDALLRLGEETNRPVPVILDEFPYLLDQEPGLSSLIQIALSPRSRAQRQSRARLILCGSALTTMRRLLSGTAPLRGRASLEMMIHPFSFREAAEFWDLDGNPDLAFRVHALVGGTPAYRGMSGARTIRSSRDFDRWVVDGLLSPLSAIHREGNVLLYEQAEVTDPAVYFSVLAAVSQGATRRGEIAAALSRPDSALHHPLMVLEQLRLLSRVDDAFRPRRPLYRIAEPVIRFNQLVIRPNEAVLATSAGSEVWRRVSDTVSSKIYGPHLEDLARFWCLAYADADSLDGRPNQVLPAAIPCREHRGGHELDVVAIGDQPNQPRRVLAIGEAKATTKLVDEAELDRLDHLRTLIPLHLTPRAPKLLLFSRSGFTARLQRLGAERPDVELVDLDRLYRGR
jgi:uncharacterized protein